MSTLPYKERGLSLVELMVGIAIGLVVLLIMSQVLAIQASQKQTTVSGANAQTSGAIALYTVERDARMAGFGVNGLPLLGCAVNGYFQGATAGEAFQFRFVPIMITTGAGSDTLTITYGTSDGNLSPARMAAPHSGNTAEYQLDNRFGFQHGDFIIVGEDGVDPDGDGVNDCTLGQVTALPTASGRTNNISADGNSYVDAHSGRTRSTPFNKPGGMGIPYRTGARIYNMGTPVSRSYAVNADTAQLTVQDNISATAPQAIAESVVALKAQYGKDTGNDGSIDIYDTATPTTVAGWSQVIGLRVAIVTRSANREAETVSPATLKLWPDIPGAAGAAGTTVTAVSTGPTLALTAEQRHYRYRVFQTLVPLRNLIWKIPATS